MGLQRKISRQREIHKLDTKVSGPENIRASIAAMKDGFTRHRQGDLTGAVMGYREALSHNPKFAEAHNALGVALFDSGDWDGALEAHRTAIMLKPDYADACLHCGDILLLQRHYIAAAQMLQRAINSAPENAGIYDKLGQALFRMFLLPQAQAAYQAGLKIDPDNTSLLHNSALVHMLLGERAEANAALQRAISLGTGNHQTKCYLLTNKLYLCDWDNIEALSHELVRNVCEQKLALDPFSFQGFPTAPSNEAQLICALANGETVAASLKLAGGGPAYTHMPRAMTHDRIRIGYVSMDFRSHPMAYLMTGILEKHDRSDFEIFAYSYGPPDSGPERKRFIEVTDHFTDIHNMTDIEAAKRIHADGIDILIDRKGYTFGHRLGIFARRPAPVQVNYLAFGGTMGVDFIDYAVVDAFVVPPDQQQFYTERLVYLPDTYQPNSARPVTGETPSRAACGLPDGAFVFCCFNQTYKITPGCFDLWMRILRRTPGSVLWLLKPDQLTADNLRREAAARGIDPGRLAFAPKAPQAEHLARHRRADLFLDTLVVNALTTASDALHMGIPVITFPGETFVSRGAGSILQALEMPELIAGNLAEYEEMAVAIASSPARMLALRHKIAGKRETAPLFDSARYTLHLDAAFREMWRLRQSGEGPKPFSVRRTPDHH